MDAILLSLHLVTVKPEFPSVQTIASQCQVNPACAKAKSESEHEADLRRTADGLKPFGTYGNGYSYGQCTYYVASRIQVPEGLGNATNWSSLPWRSGDPRRGAIAQTSVGWAGHVAVVEAVQGDMVLVSEMNYNGLGLVDFRWTPISDWNYIYL